MGLLDNLFKKKPKVESKPEHIGVDEAVEKLVIKEPEPTTAPTQTKTVSGLNLSKEIGLNLNKLNLDKPEVLAKNLFLLDVSGSMNDRVKDGRKIEHLRDVMKNYEDGKKICFSSDVERVNEAVDIPNPNGGTDLAYALHFIREEQRPLPERIVLVSDGEPDSKKDALDEAKELGLPIDIIFIGDKGSDGEKFMEELSKQTGGQHFVV